MLIGSFVTPCGLPANAPAADDTDAVDVEQGWSLGGTYTSVYSTLEVDGPSAMLVAAHFSPNKNTLSTTQGGQVVNGAALVAANSLDVGVGGLVVEPIFSVEIGLLGGARKGAVTVDPGTTFSLVGSTYVYVPVVDNGALIFGGAANVGGSASGGVSGTGILVVNANGGGTVKGGITGLAGITVNDGGSLTATDATSGVGAINAGVKGSLALGSVTGSGPITIGANSTLGATSLQDDGAIAIGSGAVFNVSVTMQRSAGNGMAVSMGSSSVLNLSG